MEIAALAEIHQVPSNAALKVGPCGFSRSEIGKVLAKTGEERDRWGFLVSNTKPSKYTEVQAVLSPAQTSCSLVPSRSPSLTICNSYIPAMQDSLQQRVDEPLWAIKVILGLADTVMHSPLDMDKAPFPRQECFCARHLAQATKAFLAGNLPPVSRLNWSTLHFALC